MKAVETWGYLGFNRRLHAYEVLLGDASQATGHCVSPELLDQSLTPISNVMQDDFWCLWWALPYPAENQSRSELLG
jgi:hypothetical protein